MEGLNIECRLVMRAESGCNCPVRAVRYELSEAPYFEGLHVRHPGDLLCLPNHLYLVFINLATDGLAVLPANFAPPARCLGRWLIHSLSCLNTRNDDVAHRLDYDERPQRCREVCWSNRLPRR